MKRFVTLKKQKAHIARAAQPTSEMLLHIWC